MEVKKIATFFFSTHTVIRNPPWKSREWICLYFKDRLLALMPSGDGLDEASVQGMVVVVVMVRGPLDREPNESPSTAISF